ncbi:MAG: DUF4360 domain-containing protein [Oligoflexus sp.]|nr:DUF4360 domain-containing protein [Oligoflexus sp.]
MSMISNLAKLLVPAALLLSATAFATDTTTPAPATTTPAAPVVEGPVPGTVQIKKITAAGTGCPDASTYSTNISPDNQAFTVTFSDFIAEVGAGIPLSAGRKNCSLTLDLQIPNGWQFSIATFNYRGFMDLGDKVQAEHTTSYFFQGQPSGTFQAKEVGPKSKDFVYTEKLGLTSVYIPNVWSPCNISRALTINPSIRVSKMAGAKAGAQGLITNDSVDGEIKQVFGMVWRRC